MPEPFYVGREDELRGLILKLDNQALDKAACVGRGTSEYHPMEGEPSPEALTRCTQCPARLACLALALRAEEPDLRYGWYGGVGPEERTLVALALDEDFSPLPEDEDDPAVALRRSGWTINDIAAELGRSRRTIQRRTPGCGVTLLLAVSWSRCRFSVAVMAQRRSQRLHEMVPRHQSRVWAVNATEPRVVGQAYGPLEQSSSCQR